MSIRHGLIGSLNPILYKEEGAQFYYRKTSGGIIMNQNPLISNIENIKGQTVAWNQLLHIERNRTTQCYGVSINWDADNQTITFNGTATGTGYHQGDFNYEPFKINIIENHSYYFRQYYKEDVILKFQTQAALGKFPINTDKKEGIIAKSNISNSRFSFVVLVVENNVYNNVVVRYSLFDLTLIYGAGNEPSTVAQFEADYQRWFGKALTYEPYDAGSLRDVQLSGLKTIGFNQWDEEWERGTYNNNTGQKVDDNTTIRCKNKIKVLPNTDYYLRCYGSHVYVYIEYDADGKYIGFTSKPSNNVFKTKQNTSFITFRLSSSYGNTYKNDICINISDTNKNGTYEPYEEYEVSIPVTTLKGKLNGEGESVVIFPDGMKGVGDIKDEIYYVGGKTYAVKRIGRVDLGSLTWIIAGEIFDGYRLNSTQTYYNIPNFICSKYNTNSGYNIAVSSVNDKCIGGQFNGRVIVRDSSYSDVETFKAAMQGVMLDYELAEPLVYEVDDFTLPVSYDCVASGTEQVLPENDGSIVNVSPIMDITYKIKK